MKHFLKLLLAVSMCVLMLACSSSSDGETIKDTDPLIVEPPIVDPQDEAMYQVEFVSTWSSTTHPVKFPGGPHFSPLVGASHKADQEIFKRGNMATDGIKLMAETGGTSKLLSEINVLKDAEMVLNAIEGSGVSSPGTTSLTFTINKDFSYVTLVSMLAPSPDWFVGIHDQNLLDENGDWVLEKIFELRLYDAGTDDGDTYNSLNAATTPRVLITRLTTDASETSFNDGNPPIGTFTFSKQ